MARKKMKAVSKKTWREVLTPDEHATVLAADAARAKWSVLAAQRAAIVNRAIQRAKAQNRIELREIPAARKRK